MENWQETRAALERKLLDAKTTVRGYEATLPRLRTITESEYMQAKRDMIDAATAIYEGDYQASKPADPLAGKSIAELEELYEQEKAKYIGDPTVKRGTGDARQGAKLLRIQTRIDQLKQEATN